VNYNALWCYNISIAEFGINFIYFYKRRKITQNKLKLTVNH